MPRYSMWVNETTYKKVYFDAADYEQAIGLVAAASDIEDELPNYTEKIKEHNIDYELMSLGEVKE